MKKYVRRPRDRKKISGQNEGREKKYGEKQSEWKIKGTESERKNRG